MNHIKIFSELHQSNDILFLGNAWDVSSALALEKAGFKAIGTTSWGIANSLGLVDGELIDFNKHLSIIKSITEHVNIPVSADIEAGYAIESQRIVYNVLEVADVGVAGINIEDSFKHKKGLRSIEEHSELLQQIRTALDQNGYEEFFINARIDTYLQKESPLLETIERGKGFVESGANGIFVPRLSKEEEIKKLVSDVNAPLNVLSLPELTNTNKLAEVGVKRLSFGNALSDKVIAYITEQTRLLWSLQDTSLLYKA